MRPMMIVRIVKPPNSAKFSMPKEQIKVSEVKRTRQKVALLSQR